MLCAFPVFCILWLSLAPGVAASKVVYGTFGEGGTATGQIGGQFGNAGTNSTTLGIAVNETGAGGVGAGDVYVSDATNSSFGNRIQRFDFKGNFIAAWGFDVIQAGKPGDLGNNVYEICTVAADCKAGVASVSPAPGGELSNPRGLAVNQQTGSLYVINGNFQRVDVFSATGSFHRTFGQDVVSTGPGDNGTGFEICVPANGDVCKAGVGGSIAGALQFPSFVGFAATSHLTVAPAGAPNAGNVIVADRGNNRVQEFTASGAFVRVFGGGVVTGGAAGTGDLNETTTISNVKTTSKAFVVGQTITGANIPVGTRIAAVGAGTITLSQAAIGSGTDVPIAVAEGAGNVPTNEIQKVTLGAGITSGNFKLAFSTPNPSPTTTVANTTANIPFNASAAEVQSALEAVGNIGTGNIAVTSPFTGGGSAPGGPYTVEFKGIRFADTDVDLLTTSPGSPPLTGGSASVVFPPPQTGANAFEVCTAAADCVAGSSGSATGQLNALQGVAADSTGAIYTVETGAPFRVQKFSPQVGPPTLSPAVFADSFLTGTTVAVQIGADNPESIAINPVTNDVYVAKAFDATFKESRILQLDSTGTELIDTPLKNAAIGNGSAGIDAFAISGTHGRIYVPDVNRRVHVLVDPPDHAPAVTTGDSSDGAVEYTRTLEGTVNPAEYKVTNCRFEYGKTTAYGKLVPCVPGHSEMGEGTVDVVVSAETDPLEPETIYHYRLVAANHGEALGEGADRTFANDAAPIADDCANAAIRAEQGIAVGLLPSCMALEQVSPRFKDNQSAKLFDVDPLGRQRVAGLSPDGKRVLFSSLGALANTPGQLGAFGDLYLATRDAGGQQWVPTPTLPPGGTVMPEVLPRAFSLDLSSWFQFLPSTEQQEAQGIAQAFRQSIDGDYEALSPVLKPSLVPSSGPQLIGQSKPGGVSADGSHFYFSPEKGNSYQASDPLPTGFGSINNTYVFHRDDQDVPAMELLARDHEGKVWGGNCGALVGSANEVSSVLNPISRNGKRVYFSTRPGQPASGACSSFTNKLRILKRVETEEGPWISQLFGSECNRVSPSCSAANGDDLFDGASVDGTKVYFRTERQLANSDLDSGFGLGCVNEFAFVEGCDLYLYDSTEPVGQRLTQVSAGEASATTPGAGANVIGVAATSPDGSHAYFVAQDVLTTDPGPEGKVAQTGQRNLYLYDAEDEDLSFIATLASGEAAGESYPVPVLGENAQGVEIGGDSHIFVFTSTVGLTADDTDGGRKDLFRYDSETGQLERVSVGGPGGLDNGPFDVSGLIRLGVGNPQSNGSPDYPVRARWVSEDGETVLFKTAEPLLPGDGNKSIDSYMWRQGEVYRLPGTADTSGTLKDMPMVSADGSTVAFQSYDPLSSLDGDTAADVYVARVDGGFTFPKVSECKGEACQEPFRAQPQDEQSGSAGFAGSSNLKPKSNGGSRRCPRGKRLVRRAGKVRCVKRSARKTQHNRHADTHRRAAK